MARLNDTAALVEQPAKPGSSTSVSVEKIENGYVTRETSFGPGDKYRSKETFSKEPPRVTTRVEPQPSGVVGDEGLGGAISELNK